MEELENKSTNDLLFQVKQLEADHESLKLKMLNDYDKLLEIEETFKKVTSIINKRLKGEI